MVITYQIISTIYQLIDMLQHEDIMPETSKILKQLKDGQVKEAYRNLQYVIEKPDLDPQLKAELANISLSLSIRILSQK